MEPGHVLVHHMDLVLAVSADHPALLLQGVTTVNRRLALLDDQLVGFVLLDLQLCGLPLWAWPGFLHLVQLLPFLNLAHSPRTFEEPFPGTQLGAGRGVRKACLFETSLRSKEAVIALDSLGDPCVGQQIHSTIFFVIILEVMPSSVLMSYSVRSARQLPSTDADPALKMKDEIGGRS